MPLEWPAAAQLGGVIALSQRRGRSDVVIGGFAGCAQVRGRLAAPCHRRCLPSVCLMMTTKSEGWSSHFAERCAQCVHVSRAEPPSVKQQALAVVQVVELVPADVEAMSRAQVSRLCASLLPDSWLTAPQEVSSLRTPAMRNSCVSTTVQWHGHLGL